MFLFAMLSYCANETEHSNNEYKHFLSTELGITDQNFRQKQYEKILSKKSTDKTQAITTIAKIIQQQHGACKHTEERLWQGFLQDLYDNYSHASILGVDAFFADSIGILHRIYNAQTYNPNNRYAKFLERLVSSIYIQAAMEVYGANYVPDTVHKTIDKIVSKNTINKYLKEYNENMSTAHNVYRNNLRFVMIDVGQKDISYEILMCKITGIRSNYTRQIDEMCTNLQRMIQAAGQTETKSNKQQDNEQKIAAKKRKYEHDAVAVRYTKRLNMQQYNFWRNQVKNVHLSDNMTVRADTQICDTYSTKNMTAAYLQTLSYNFCMTTLADITQKLSFATSVVLEQIKDDPGLYPYLAHKLLKLADIWLVDLHHCLELLNHFVQNSMQKYIFDAMLYCCLDIRLVTSNCSRTLDDMANTTITNSNYKIKKAQIKQIAAITVDNIQKIKILQISFAILSAEINSEWNSMQEKNQMPKIKQIGLRYK